MVSTVYSAFPNVRNAGDTGSFFAAQHEDPTDNELIYQQVDPTSPSIQGLTLISDPIQPNRNAQQYVTNFDPNLYDLRDTSHIMRLIRALTGASGAGGIRRQNTIAKLAASLTDGSFLDLDRFYGAIFGLQRHPIEDMPQNLDGSIVNPYTDLANSDIWDQVRSADARYRSRIFQLAQAINLGASYPGMVLAAESVLNCEVDVVESWVKTDLLANRSSIITLGGLSFFQLSHQYATYGDAGYQSYGNLEGQQFGAGQLPVGNRGEVIFTPTRFVTNEERYQLSHVLNTLKPSNVQVTIGTQQVEKSNAITVRGYSSDSENWQIQSRVTPALNLINPTVDVYANTGPYSQARPVYSEYSGEQWTYNPNVVRATSYRMLNGSKIQNTDDETIVYSDSTSHLYVSTDGLRDVRQSIAFRLSGEGPVTNMPYAGNRANYSLGDNY